MMPPSLNLLSPEDQAALVRASDQGIDLGNAGNPEAFVQWIETAPVPVVQYLSTTLMRAKEGMAARRMDGNLWNHEVFPRIPDRKKAMALLRTEDPDALSAWIATHVHPCQLESTLRLALHEGRHTHLPALVGAAQCLNPDMVVRIAWQASKPVPLTWALHWFDQLPHDRQQESLDPCLTGCIERYRLDWMKALIAQNELQPAPLTVNWISHVRAAVTARWTAGVAWLAQHAGGQPAVKDAMAEAIQNGQAEEANWMMSRLPLAVRAGQLETWEMKRPGLFAEAQRQYEAERRQQSVIDQAPTQARRRRPS